MVISEQIKALTNVGAFFMPCAVVRRAFFIGEKRRRPHHIYLMCSKRRMRTMTMAELYAAPEKLDGGVVMVEPLKRKSGS